MNSSAECKLGLVVSEDVEAAALDKVTEVLAGKVGSKQLAVKGTVAPLTGFYLFGKEGNQAAIFINALLKKCTHCCVRSICHDAGGGIRDRMHEE